MSTSAQPAPRRHYRCYSPLQFRCGHPRDDSNTYTNRVTQVTSCLICRRRRSSRKRKDYVAR